MPPGTISLISVPEFGELTSVSLPLMRTARRAFPEVRSVHPSPDQQHRNHAYAIVGYAHARSCPYVELDLQFTGDECTQALRIASYPMR